MNSFVKYQPGDKEYLEHFDPTPVELPAGMDAPETMLEMIARMVDDRVLMAQLDKNHIETFQEADDFGAPDSEEMPLSGFEVHRLVEEEGRGGLDPKTKITSKPVAELEVENQRMAQEIADLKAKVPGDEKK